MKIIGPNGIIEQREDWATVMDQDIIGDGLFAILKSMKWYEMSSVRVDQDYFN